MGDNILIVHGGGPTAVMNASLYGTLKEAGFFWVNPFCTALNPTVRPAAPVVSANGVSHSVSVSMANKKV